MQEVNDCFSKVKKDCFKFISSQETKKDKFRNKEKMIKSFLIPVSQWISKKSNKKKTLVMRALVDKALEKQLSHQFYL